MRTCSQLSLLVCRHGRRVHRVFYSNAIVVCMLIFRKLAKALALPNYTQTPEAVSLWDWQYRYLHMFHTTQRFNCPWKGYRIGRFFFVISILKEDLLPKSSIWQEVPHSEQTPSVLLSTTYNTPSPQDCKDDRLHEANTKSNAEMCISGIGLYIPRRKRNG